MGIFNIGDRVKCIDRSKALVYGMSGTIVEESELNKTETKELRKIYYVDFSPTYNGKMPLYAFRLALDNSEQFKDAVTVPSLMDLIGGQNHV